MVPPSLQRRGTLPLFAGLTHRIRRRSSRRWLGGGCDAPELPKAFQPGAFSLGAGCSTDPVIAVCAIYQSIIRRREGICQGPRGTLIGNLQAPPCSIPSCHSPVIAKKKTSTNLRLVAAPFVVPLTGIYPRAKKPAAGSFFTHCGAPPCSIPRTEAPKNSPA